MSMIKFAVKRPVTMIIMVSVLLILGFSPTVNYLWTCCRRWNCR